MEEYCFTMRALHCLALFALAFAWAPGAMAQEALYRLPYLDGQAYTISQARGGFITTHTTPDSRHAVDFRMPEGTPVVAARDGVVIAAEWRHEGGARRQSPHNQGNMVGVRHADGTLATYAHLEHAGVSVEAGEEIWAGRIVGYSGSTGYVSGPHLHFAVTHFVRSGGAVEEVSLPVKFYNGNPPVEFTPRVGLAVTARPVWSATESQAPAAAPLPVARASAAPPPPPPEVLAGGFARLAAACLLLVAGMAWFYRFSRS